MPSGEADDEKAPHLMDAGPNADRYFETTRLTFPAFRHLVHTFCRFGVPLASVVRTRWMFGLNRRLVRRCECETLMPNPGPLPQTSQTEATGFS